ncbi:TetR/AcrR family transcriptional regulator [Halobacillus sp. A5]|uniref:TetR/AcrR family transcriptional regulator n=1 Tax=Halobacillus sp. A5 TaxID=2880263 RepID=UPI0020A6571B|nr:TetR/AcrR family transcriptional regulator [Halobacillus sp. A5]MCP3027335.1 TetR/AcrR family transcriptional regulator [Halobacillus sp. A5]
MTKDLNELIQILEEGEQKKTPKQTQILKAAVETFAEKGYASTSTSEIAAKAGVAEGTIFRHYKTKKELLLSIVTPVMVKFTLPVFASHFAEQVFEQLPQDFEELLYKIIKNRYEFVKENHPLVRIMLQEMAFHKDLQEQFRLVFLEHVYPRFEHLIAHYKQEDRIIELPAPSAIRMIMTSLIGFIFTRFIIAPDLEWDDEKEMERTVQFIMHGLSK